MFRFSSFSVSVSACASAVYWTKVELKVIQSMLCDRLLYPNAWYSRLVGNYCWLWFPHEFGHLWLCSCCFSLSFIYTPCILMRRVYCVRRTAYVSKRCAASCDSLTHTHPTDFVCSSPFCLTIAVIRRRRSPHCFSLPARTHIFRRCCCFGHSVWH